MWFFNLHDRTFDSLLFCYALSKIYSFAVILYELLKGQRINHSFLRKLLEWCHCKPLIHHLYITDSPVIPIICRLVFRASSMYTSFLAVHCISSFLLVRAVDQKRRQLTVRFYSRWYIMRTGVGVLARKIKLTSVKSVLMTIFLKRPHVLNDHAVVLP